MKPWKVKVCDFKNASKVDKRFADCVGMYNPPNRTIYLSDKLPRFCQGTMRSTYEHELVHAKLDEAGIEMPLKQEEDLATYLTVISCPTRYQTNEEKAFKDFLCRGRSWSRKKDRPALIREACQMAGIDVSPKITRALR